MTWANVSFTTCHNGMPHTYGVVADRRGGAAEVSPAEFTALARAANRPGAAAYGKVALVRRGEVAVYQADAAGGVTPAFCGNATAAALCLVNDDGGGRLRLLGGAGEGYEASARIIGREVSQTWIVPEVEIRETIWRGCLVLILDVLNPYALVAGPLPEGINPETARRELLGPGPTTKLAVIAVAERTPFVEFYNANGRHGGVPMTGLASIAIAVRSVTWVAAVFADRRIAYRTRDGLTEHDLPAVSPTWDGRAAVAMPVVTVDLGALVLGEPV